MCVGKPGYHYFNDTLLLIGPLGTEHILVKFEHRLQNGDHVVSASECEYTRNIHFSRRFIVAYPFSKWIPTKLKIARKWVIIPLIAANGLVMRCDERLQYHL